MPSGVEVHVCRNSCRGCLQVEVKFTERSRSLMVTNVVLGKSFSFRRLSPPAAATDAAAAGDGAVSVGDLVDDDRLRGLTVAGLTEKGETMTSADKKLVADGATTVVPSVAVVEQSGFRAFEKLLL